MWPCFSSSLLFGSCCSSASVPQNDSCASRESWQSAATLNSFNSHTKSYCTAPPGWCTFQREGRNASFVKTGNSMGSASSSRVPRAALGSMGQSQLRSAGHHEGLWSSDGELRERAALEGQCQGHQGPAALPVARGPRCLRPAAQQRGGGSGRAQGPAVPLALCHLLTLCWRLQLAVQGELSLGRERARFFVLGQSFRGCQFRVQGHRAQHGKHRMLCPPHPTAPEGTRLES